MSLWRADSHLAYDAGDMTWGVVARAVPPHFLPHAVEAHSQGGPHATAGAACAADQCRVSKCCLPCLCTGHWRGDEGRTESGSRCAQALDD